MEPQLVLEHLVGNPPFPWQARLLREFIADRVPRALDLPTGLGKTAVMAIWLAARACGARHLPRRLVYVVDRRAVVDQATREAVSLRERAGQPALASMLGLDRPLPISTLRGQFVDNREWLEDPACPAILVGTVDMVGSRLLFEGYACSRKMRPYHAGLLGCDTLFVLDEAHLVPPFERLLEQATGRPELAPTPDVRALVPPARLLSLSATGRVHGEASFRLDDDDLKNPIVLKRIQAVKRLTFERLPAKAKLPEVLAERAWSLAAESDEPVRVIVFSHRREDAEKAMKELDKRAGKSKPECAMFIGARRIRERVAAEADLRRLGFLAGSERPAGHAFLFATSAGEVGVDLDADHMVADVVAWERMVQRLGRVNRRGERAARVVLVGDPASAWTDLVEPLLGALPAAGEQHAASPAALGALRNNTELADALRQATTPEPLYPALSRPVLEAWAMTSLDAHTGRPEVQPWLRGWLPDDPPQTSVLWRRHLPVILDDRRLTAFFEAAPPHTSERLDTETFRVVGTVTARAAKLLRRGADHRPFTPDDGVGVVLDPAGTPRGRLTLAALAAGDSPDGRKELERQLAGHLLVLDARFGALSPEGLLDESVDEVPPTADAGGGWLAPHGDEPVVPFRVRLRAEDDDSDDTPDSGWRERLRIALTHSEDEEVTRWLVVEKWRHDGANEEDRSSAGRAQTLAEHQRWTADEADQIAQDLQLPEPHRRALVIAARLHDEGKRAKRWQQAFSARAGEVYAKTRGPIHFRRLDGYRHELGSLPIAAEDPEVRALPSDLRELVLHLIAAHHGFARPVIRTSGCDDAPPSAVEVRAREVALRFVALQARWGPWGLAWWETLLRAADQRASRRNDMPQGER